MIIGFGQHYMDKTREFCNRIAAAASESDNIRSAVEEIARSEGTFKEKGWVIARCRRIEEIEPKYTEDRIVVVEGSYNHYRDDHPMSPDGYASWEVNWCVTIIEDEIWGSRTFISI